MYLYELINWLTTVVDELKVQDKYKNEAYRGAVAYVAESFMVGLYQCVMIYSSDLLLHRVS